MSMPPGRPLRAVRFAVGILPLLFVPSALADPAPPYEVLIGRLGQNPAALEAAALYDAAEANALQARVLPNPSIAVEAEDAYGSGPYSGYDNAQTTFSINQPLELWGQRGARIDAARAAADAAGLRRDQVRWLTAGRLALAYAEAEAALLRHQLAGDALLLAKGDARAAQTLVDEGREPRLRAVQANGDVAVAQALLDEAQANRAAALARLTAVALLDVEVTSIPSSLLDRTPPPEADTAEDPLVVRVARAELQTASSLVTVERRRALPDVVASLGVRRYEASHDEALTIGINLTVPLFDRNTGAISAARAQQRAAEARLTASRIESLTEHRAARAGREAAGSRVRAAGASVATAGEAYRLARVGFEAGRISQMELRSARTALIAASNADVDARLARVRAEIDLARLEGRAPFTEAP